MLFRSKFIHYTLDLRFCKIKTLPEDLFVQNEINLNYSEIENIPTSIKTDMLLVEHTPFAEKASLRANKIDMNKLDSLYPNVNLIYI